mgnify:CR=1 FL=1
MSEFIQIEERFDGSWDVVHLRWEPSECEYVIEQVLESGFSTYDSARAHADTYTWLEVRDA